jgi:hypothetical protein
MVNNLLDMESFPEPADEPDWDLEDVCSPPSLRAGARDRDTRRT